MKQKINYITHHRNVFIKMIEEDVTPIDISIYNALFLLWNNAGFVKKLSINRNDIMMMSKVGNANTYTKSLKKLDALGIIEYLPSKNPMIGSVVTMCRFDKCSDKSTDKSTDKSSDKSTDKSSDKGGATLSKHIKLNKHNKQEEIVYPFESEEFKTQWKLWKVYRKKNHKFQYIDSKSEQRALSELKNLSEGIEKNAIAMILQSIDKGWKGFFPLKNKTEVLQTAEQGEFDIMA